MNKDKSEEEMKRQMGENARKVLEIIDKHREKTMEERNGE